MALWARSYRLPAGIFLPLGCLALTWIGCGNGAVGGKSTAIEPPARVFLIVVDTLRADHLGTYGYPRATSPFLDSLAAEGIVFDRAIAQWPKTGASMASMFTGRYPQTTSLTHRAAIRLPGEYETLAELFHDSGYTTLAVIGNAVLSSELGWNQGFDEFVEPWKLEKVPPKTPLQWRKVLSGERITAAGIRLLEAHLEDPKLFVWLHYLEPHTPYVQPEGVENPFLGDPYYTGERKIGSWFPRQEILDGRQELDYYIAQYDANILLVDRAIRSFLDRARDLGLLENALVVFTSDHGEGLGQHDELKHGRLPYNSTSRVPLFFWYPAAIDGERRVERPVELIDLYPTFRDLVAPDRDVEGFEGSSLIDFLRPPTKTSAVDSAIDSDRFRYAFSESGEQGWMHYRSIQSLEWKLIYHPKRSGRGLPMSYQLFDLDADPGETCDLIDRRRTRDLIDRRRREARALRTELFAWMKQPKRIVEGGEAANQSDATIEALKALGYLN